MSRKGKKKIQEAMGSVELNIMPFIDIFSLLCTFLLFSAVFVSIGIHVVQVPFLSNAAPTKEDQDQEKLISVKVDASASSVEIVTSMPGGSDQTKTFERNPQGLEQAHQELVRIRSENRKTDKVSLFIDETLTFTDIVDVLDCIKLRTGTDPVFDNDGMVYPKVVFGSVIL